MPDDLNENLQRLYELLRECPPDVQQVAMAVALRSAEAIRAQWNPSLPPVTPTSGGTGTSNTVTVTTQCPQGHSLTITLT